MKMGFNLQAMIANNRLSSNDEKLSAALERLTTGLKLNHAKDNPSGIAIAKRMNSQIKGLEIANRNAQDGISVVETAEGALAEIHNMLQRMNELAIQGASDGVSDTQREYIQDEVTELSKEVERITQDTSFNGQPLLDGSFDLKAYTNSDYIKSSTYTQEVPPSNYDFKITNITMNTEDNTVIEDITVDFTGATPGNEFPSDATTKVENNKLIISASGGFEMQFNLDIGTGSPADLANLYTSTTVEIAAENLGSMTLQVGANRGQTNHIQIPNVSLVNIGIEGINLTNRESCKKSISKIQYGITYISSVRSKLGAYQNGLESSSRNLELTGQNMTSAYSRLMDVNMATEMSEYTKYQTLVQAGTSMLAQANERPQQVLQLLRQ